MRLSIHPAPVTHPLSDLTIPQSQAIAEIDFIQRCAALFDCDYRKVERHYDCLNRNVLSLVHTPGGQMLLAMALTNGVGPVFNPPMH